MVAPVSHNRKHADKSDMAKTAGLVTLPGVFIGVLLGGGSPIQAGAWQVLVLIGIVCVQTLCVSVAHELI